MSGHGNGNGSGNGNGIANGSGNGTANGNGSGNGTVTAHDNGSDNGHGSGHGSGSEERTADVKYFVLGGASSPYLLARVRWPDVAQAISAGCRNWLDDLGLFDLPYEPTSTELAYAEAAAIASEWGTSLPSEQTAIECARPLIRRMPADWSGLAPAEKRAWALEFVPTGLRAEGLRRRAEAKADAGDLASPRQRSRFQSFRRAMGGFKYPTELASSTPPGGEDTPDRRRHARVPTGGHAEIRCGGKTVSATLMDLSQGGVRWRMSDTHTPLRVGEQLHHVLVLEGSGPGKQVSLDVGATVMWGNDMEPGAQFGVAFQQLTEEQNEQVQHLLVSSASRRSA
jgi:hypothetical protein